MGGGAKHFELVDDKVMKDGDGQVDCQHRRTKLIFSPS